MINVKQKDKAGKGDVIGSGVDAVLDSMFMVSTLKKIRPEWTPEGTLKPGMECDCLGTITVE